MKCSFDNILNKKSMFVSMPSITHSSSARFIFAIAASLFSACTISFAIIESYTGGIVYPVYTAVSILTPFPPGKFSSVIFPGHGLKFLSGFSAFILHSIACPLNVTSFCVNSKPVSYTHLTLPTNSRV